MGIAISFGARLFSYSARGTLMTDLSSDNASKRCDHSLSYGRYYLTLHAEILLDISYLHSADNLAKMPGFAKMRGVAVDRRGRADPKSQLFRSSAVGVETGPMISQVKRASSIFVEWRHPSAR